VRMIHLRSKVRAFCEWLFAALRENRERRRVEFHKYRVAPREGNHVLRRKMLRDLSSNYGTSLYG